MGIFSRRKDQSSPAAGEPGSSSQPEGPGPVDLSDRTDGGAPDTNQARTEPMSPTPDHPEPMGAADLSRMSPGVTDPQAPSRATVRETRSPVGGPAPTGLGGPGSRLEQQRPQVDTGTSTGQDRGPLTPEQHTSGQAHRAPGSLGTTPAGEAVETDTAASAGRTSAAQVPDPHVDRRSRSGHHGQGPSGHGDTASAPSTGDGPMPGTSEELPVVQGVRLPDAAEGAPEQ